jgi:hypothetical protein
MNDNQTDKLTQFAVEKGIIASNDASKIHNASKPHVVVPGGDVKISDSAKSLFSEIAKTKELYLRDGQVFQIAEHDGILKLELLKPAAACSKFEDYVAFMKKTKGKEGPTLVPTVLSTEQAEKYLSAEAKKLLPEIQSIINCPLIVEKDDKLFILKKGYDLNTKTLVTQDIDLVDVGLEEAVESLNGILDDYDFQTLGDHSRAIASLITPAMKFGGHINGPIPVDVAEADQSQSGKTYRQQIIAAIYGETCNVVTKQEGGGVGSNDEKFGSALVDGRPFIQFDNVRGRFSLQSLESFMTAQGRFPARPAYSKVLHVDPAKFMIMLSSNGFQTTPDLANRSSIIRIRKREGYHFKKWEVGGKFQGHMLEFVQSNRAYVLSCIFTIIREWHKYGKQRSDETRHDFREWCQKLDWIVQNILGEAPLMDGHKEAQTRASNPDHTFMRIVAVAADRDQKLNTELKASEIYGICEEHEIRIPGIAPSKQHDDETGPKVIGKIMSRLFENGESIEIDNYQVARLSTRNETVNSSFSSKTYIISRKGDRVRTRKSVR